MEDFTYWNVQVSFWEYVLVSSLSTTKPAVVETYHQDPKVPIAANWKGVCLQNRSKPHSYHLKIW